MNQSNADIFLILRCKVLNAICKMGSDGLISSQYLPGSTPQYSIFDPLPCSDPIQDWFNLQIKDGGGLH